MKKLTLILICGAVAACGRIERIGLATARKRH